MVEPLNEAAVVDHADEKTLVEEEHSPRAQQAIDQEPQTAISSGAPPIIHQPNRADTEEISDPTIRRNGPLSTPPVSGAKGNKPNVYADLEKDLKSPVKTPSSTKITQRTGDPLGLRGALQLCTGMMILGFSSVLGMHFSTGTIADMAFIMGSSSLTMGTLWLITSDFGFTKPNMGISIGGASIVAVATGVLAFGSANTANEDPKPVEEPTEVIPSVEVAKTEVEPEVTETEQTKVATKSSKSDTRSMGATTATVRDADKSNQAHQEMFAAANNYLNSKDASPSNKSTGSTASEDSFDLGDDFDAPSRPSDLTPPSEPKEVLDDDLDLDGFDDLGLDEDEEDKKGLFGRKDKEEPKSEPKPEPKASASSDIKVDIPTSVLDIIIRNNKDVKGCYVQQRSETGTFPKSTDVMFTLQPHGKVSSAYIASGPYVGSKFEGCLRSAFKGMTFPPFDSNAKPQTLKYTLQL
jgi:hypothetical protein